MITKWAKFNKRDQLAIGTMVSDLAEANNELAEIKEKIETQEKHAVLVVKFLNKVGERPRAMCNVVIDKIKNAYEAVYEAVLKYGTLIDTFARLKKAYEKVIPTASSQVTALINSVTKQKITTSEMSIGGDVVTYGNESANLTKSIPYELLTVMTEARNPKKEDEAAAVEANPPENDRVRISDIPVTQQNYSLVAVQVSGNVFRILRFISSRGTTKYKDQLQEEEENNIERYKQTGTYNDRAENYKKLELLKDDDDNYEECVEAGKAFLAEKQIESNITSIASTVKWRFSDGSKPSTHFLDYDGERKLQLVVVPTSVIQASKEEYKGVADMRRDGIWLYGEDKKNECPKCAVCDAHQEDKNKPKSAGLIVGYDESDNDLIKGLATRFCWHPKKKCKTSRSPNVDSKESGLLTYLVSG